MSATVVSIFSSNKAKADGVALAVACTASRVGLTPAQVRRCAQAAYDRVRAGVASPAKVYSDASAELRAEQPAEIA